MKILLALLVAILAIALSFRSVKGAGVNLSWDDCGTYGAALATFACDTNAGLQTLVGSFVAPAGVDSMTGSDIVIDLQSDGTSLPSWWQLATGSCRVGSLSWSVDFTAGPFGCSDYWQGGALALGGMTDIAGKQARITASIALPEGDPRITGIPEGTEVYSFKMLIRNLKTAGEGACAGCETGVCIVLNSIQIHQPPAYPRFLLANPGTRQHVGWQCESFISHFGCKIFCFTPARSGTWGQVKQLYR